jgi:hypothetical protein
MKDKSLIQHGKHVSIEAKSNQFLELTGTVRRTLDLQTDRQDWDLQTLYLGFSGFDGRR